MSRFFSIFSYLGCCLICSCLNQPAAKFPEKESEFRQPGKQKLTFTPAKKIDWQLVGYDTLQNLPPDHFDLEKLPSKPLGKVAFNPLKKKPTEIKLEPDSITSTSFSLDTIVERKVKYSVSVLGSPKRIKASMPRLKDGATQSLFLFGQDQGLPGTIGQAFLQDAQGSLWIATDNGLCQFDGEFCNIYSIEQGLTNNWSTSIMKDRQGRIWLGSGTGMDIVDLKSGLVSHLGIKEGLISNFIINMMEDDEGIIWIIGGGGRLYQVNEKAGTMKLVGTNAGLSTERVLNIHQDDEKRIWLNMEPSGVNIINKEQKTVTYIRDEFLAGNSIVNKDMVRDRQGNIFISNNSKGLTWINLKKGIIQNINTEHGLSHNDIRSIKTDMSGHIWIGTNGGGVDVFNPLNNQIQNFNTSHGLSNNNVFAILPDNQGQVWIGTNGGELTIYRPGDISLQHFTGAHGLNNKTSFLYALTEDEDSSLWVGSFGGGINIINDKKHLISLLDKTNGLSDDNVQDLYTDEAGNIWVATAKGTDIINKKTGTIFHKPFTVSLIRGARDNKMLFAAGGLFILDNQTSLIKIINQKNGLVNNVVQSIAQDGKKRIWVGTNMGIDIIDENEGTVQHINADKYLGRSQILCLLHDASGRMWAGTSGGGLYMIDQDEMVTQFTIEEGLANDFVLSLLEKDGKIYAGTGKGLSVLTPFNSSIPGQQGISEQWTIKSYGKPQGFLRVDFNPRAYVDKKGTLWWTEADVLTSMKENPNKQHFATQRVSITGIEIMGKRQEFNSSRERDNIFANTDTLWDANGLSFFVKGTLPADSGYLVSNKITWDSVEGVNRLPVNLTLPFDQNHLTIHFTATHLSNGDNTAYRYILKGIDKEWNDITGKAFADYRNLPPGKYTFHVKSRGGDRKWSEETTFQFKINPPWWKAGWAYIFYAICLIALVFAGDRIQRSRLISRERERSREIELQQAREIEKAYHTLKTTQSQLIQSEKMASLGELTAGIAHEIQNPLNFVNNFSEVNVELINEMKDELSRGNVEEAKSIADDINGNEQKINFHGKRADAIVKGMLQHSRSSTGAKEPTDINALADEYLRLSYHGLRAKDKSFNATLKTDFDEAVGNINIIPQDIGRVILNLITNAFYSVNEKKKAGINGYEPTVSLSTRMTNDKVTISVADNGNGIPQKAMDKIFQPFFTTKPTGEGTGLGLSMSYDIVNKGHGGELTIKNNEGEGATFIITLPK
jgi:ligand-binding sensor domain-containing protein/signal transduction histidine kinase